MGLMKATASSRSRRVEIGALVISEAVQKLVETFEYEDATYFSLLLGVFLGGRGVYWCQKSIIVCVCKHICIYIFKSSKDLFIYCHFIKKIWQILTFPLTKVEGFFDIYIILF